MTVLIGKQAPDFNAHAIVDSKIVKNFSLQQFRGQYVILFFYPLNFTFVCPTELHAFQERLEEFEKRQAQVIGCSVDSVNCHDAWLRTPKNKGGIEGIDYPIVSDIHKSISKDYDVLSTEGVAYRGLFLIDKNGVVRHQVVNDLPIGRSVDEALRTLDALILFEQEGEVCPANWRKGEKALQPTLAGVEQYFAG